MTIDEPSADARPPRKEPETPLLVLARVVHRLGYLAEHLDDTELGRDTGLALLRLSDEGIERLGRIRAIANGEDLDNG